MRALLLRLAVVLLLVPGIQPALAARAVTAAVATATPPVDGRDPHAPRAPAPAGLPLPLPRGVIPAANRVDMVYSPTRGIVYISSSDGQLLRYDLASHRFLAPVALGGSPAGIDLAPDERHVAVADRASTEAQLWVHEVDLDTLAVRRIPFAKAFYEGGTWSVAYASGDQLLVSSRFNGSGWVPLRRVDLATGADTTVASVRQDTMLSASGDRDTVAFAESNISDGAWGLYDLPTGGVVRRSGPYGTGWFNFEIATDALGGAFALPTYGGMYVYDADFGQVGIIGTYAGGQPVGAAYDPTRPVMYLPWADSDEIRIYDTRTLQHTGTWHVRGMFRHTGNAAYTTGRVRVAADGSVVLVSVPDGIAVFRP